MASNRSTARTAKKAARPTPRRAKKPQRSSKATTVKTQDRMAMSVVMPTNKVMDPTVIDLGARGGRHQTDINGLSGLAVTFGRRALWLGAQLGFYAAGEVVAAQRYAASITHARTPYQAAQAHGANAWALWERMMGQWASMGAVMTHSMHADVAAVQRRV